MASRNDSQQILNTIQQTAEVAGQSRGAIEQLAETMANIEMASVEMAEQLLSKEERRDISTQESFKVASKKNISDRDDSYTKLLKHFVNITQIRNIVKEIHKWIYFWIIIASIFYFGIIVLKLVDKIELSGDNWVVGLTTAISCLVSLSSVMISIPLIITKYLFNSKEEKKITKIILHTQDHDLNGRRIIENSIENSDGKDNTSINQNDSDDKLLMEQIDKKAWDMLDSQG